MCINSFNTQQEHPKIDIINPHFQYVETKEQRLSNLLKCLHSQNVVQTGRASDSTEVKVNCSLVSPKITASKSFWKPISPCFSFHIIFAFPFHPKEMSNSFNFLTLLWKQWTIWQYLYFTYRKLRSRFLNVSPNDALWHSLIYAVGNLVKPKVKRNPKAI